MCKNGDDDLIDFVYRMFVIQLEKTHCQKRYTTMLLIEQLFPRSHRFRTVFTDQANLNKFFELTLGTNREKPLPKPKSYANLLKEKVNQLIKQWIQEFGRGYPYLEQVYKLALSLTLTANTNDSANAANQLDRQTQSELRLIDKIERKLIEYASLEDELPEQLTQVRNCFELIIPKDEFKLDAIDGDKEIDREMARLITATKAKQQVSITLKPYLEIKVDENNEDAVRALKDLYKQLVNHYLPKIKNLLKHLSKGGKRCESEIKQLIENKDEVLKLVSMYTELRFVDKLDSMADESDSNDVNDESTTDDDDFEEVEEKDIEYEIPPERWVEYGVENPFVNQYSNDDPNQPSTSGLSNLVNYDSKACNIKMSNGQLCQRKDKGNVFFVCVDICLLVRSFRRLKLASLLS